MTRNEIQNMFSHALQSGLRTCIAAQFFKEGYVLSVNLNDNLSRLELRTYSKSPEEFRIPPIEVVTDLTADPAQVLEALQKVVAELRFKMEQGYAEIQD